MVVSFLLLMMMVDEGWIEEFCLIYVFWSLALAISCWICILLVIVLGLFCYLLICLVPLCIGLNTILISSLLFISETVILKSYNDEILSD